MIGSGLMKWNGPQRGLRRAGNLTVEEMLDALDSEGNSEVT